MVIKFITMESADKGYPLVSVIIPCWNEEEFIDACLDSTISNDYPKDKLEILVVDGMSEDGTRHIIERYVGKYPFIKLIRNHQKITSCGLNKGIEEAGGKYILWMSGHNTYSKAYILKCVEYSLKSNAENVGGIIKVIPRNSSFIGKRIALVFFSFFQHGKF